jgi:hypothetical protein
MQAARPALLLPFLLLASPFSVYAVPLIIDYEGTVAEVSDAPAGYVVGSRIAGRLLIDPLVPWYIPEPASNQASYHSDDPDFVRGFWMPGGDGFDRVFIGNEIVRMGTDRAVDIFAVQDVYVVEGGSGDGARTFSLNATLHDFLDQVSLEQSFEVTSADADDPHENLSGRISWSNLGPFPFVDFIIDRLTVKPNVCRP